MGGLRDERVTEPKENPEDKPVESTGEKPPVVNQDELNQVIHDLNGELFLIRGFSEIVKGRVGDDEAARKALRKIEERTHVLAKLSRQMRRWRREPQHEEPPLEE
jgi:hypothetical protein